VSPERLKRFFTKVEHGYRVGTEIREMVVFAPQSLIHGSALHQAGYFELPQPADLSGPGDAEETHSAVSLQPESRRHPVSRQRGDGRGFTDLFAPLAANCGSIGEPSLPHRSRSSFPRPLPRPCPPGPSASGNENAASLQSLADQLVLELYSPPAVLVNDKGDILYVSGRTGKYLEPAAGKANWNIFVMARAGLRYELTNAFQKVLRQEGAVALRGLKSKPTAGSIS
jgi:two-component system, chemotaxis family, CheB/CheR fusion protein